MNPWMWRPGAASLGDLERQMSHLLDFTFDLVQRHLFLGAKPHPAGNLYEMDSEFCLLIPLPGVTADRLDIQIVDNTLTVRGERQPPASVPEDSYRRQERWHGPWSRTLELPPRVDVSQISASVENGLLLVRLPKLPQMQPQRVAIHVGSSHATPAKVRTEVVERNGR
ncbi:MAG TPA: Hsp20/alpha crystallin family protein [Gemmatales bacterium]|nr:Hsp20/alpha crystallin family protein [Gemmatales bacterium]HMP60340.1 Hsp20/alpha crystallin family protein [Gemmatales bacterium]